MLIALGIVPTASFAVGWLVAGRTLRPLRVITGGNSGRSAKASYAGTRGPAALPR